MKPLALCPNPMVLEEPCKLFSFSSSLLPPFLTLILEEQATALAEAVEKKLKLIDELQEQQIKLQAEQEAGKKA